MILQIAIARVGGHCHSEVGIVYHSSTEKTVLLIVVFDASIHTLLERVRYGVVESFHYVGVGSSIPCRTVFGVLGVAVFAERYTVIVIACTYGAVAAECSDASGTTRHWGCRSCR